MDKDILLRYLVPALASSTNDEQFISHVEDLEDQGEGKKTLQVGWALFNTLYDSANLAILGTLR